MSFSSSLLLSRAFFFLMAGAVSQKATAASLLFTLTGSAETGIDLLIYDANSFALRGGTPLSTVGFLNDLATDESGRLFAIANGPGTVNSFYEFDPVTRSVINHATRDASVGGAGLAAFGGRIYTLTGFGSSNSLLSYDANNFKLLGGVPQESVGFLNDLAFDVTGRLFGVGNGPIDLNSFYEFNPFTLEIINHVTRDGAVGGAGLAARNGKIYTLSGSVSGLSGGLLAYDMNTFELLAGTPEGVVGFLNDLAFDQEGRLFGIGNGPTDTLNSFYEFDPDTLEVIAQGTRDSSIGGAGLAALVIPEPSCLILSLVGVCLMVGRRTRIVK